MRMSIGVFVSQGVSQYELTRGFSYCNVVNILKYLRGFRGN